MKGRSIHFLIFALLSFGSCKNQQEQKECLKSHISKIMKTKEVKSISSNLGDSLTKWANQNVRLAKNFKSEKYSWELDAVVFNNSKNRLFGWILKRDLDKTATFDYIIYFVGERLSGQWHFYLASMPSMPTPRDSNYDYLSRKKGTPFSFEDLSEVALHEAITGGLLKNGSCEINYDYINEWFTEPLSEYHQRYLNDTVP